MSFYQYSHPTPDFMYALPNAMRGTEAGPFALEPEADSDAAASAPGSKANDQVWPMVGLCHRLS